MKKYYYNKTKVASRYGMYFAVGAFGLVGICIQFNGFPNFYICLPFILYACYNIACILRRVYFREAVVSIMPDRLIVDKIDIFLIHRNYQIAFQDIYYISTDIEKNSKKFYLKTKDETEYHFNFTMLDSTHEEIVEEMKRCHKELLNAGIFEIDYNNSLNMD